MQDREVRRHRRNSVVTKAIRLLDLLYDIEFIRKY